MHDDPTRMMGTPEDPNHRPHGNMRLLVAGLIAVIVGLVIALLVVTGDDGDSGSTLPSEVSTLSTATQPTELTTETTAPETEPTTEPTPTTTEAPTTPPEGDEEGGSGGIEAP